MEFVVDNCFPTFLANTEVPFFKKYNIEKGNSQKYKRTDLKKIYI